MRVRVGERWFVGAHGFLHAVAMCVKHCALYTRVPRCVACHVIESLLYGAFWQGRESLWTERFVWRWFAPTAHHPLMFALWRDIFFTLFVAMRCVSDPLKRRDGVKCQVREDCTASQRRKLNAETGMMRVSLESFCSVTHDTESR